jgi:hypothetical protein
LLFSVSRLSFTFLSTAVVVGFFHHPLAGTVLVLSPDVIVASVTPGVEAAVIDGIGD